MQLENVGSLITYKNEAGEDVCLGYLFDFSGKGVFSPDGKVAVSKADADTHNRLLDEAMLKGLDENCAVGQGGTFYFQVKDGKPQVSTWLGTLVSERVRISGKWRKTIYFHRNGKDYKGVLQKDADCFNFRRVRA